jgi:hypothetical protein
MRSVRHRLRRTLHQGQSLTCATAPRTRNSRQTQYGLSSFMVKYIYPENHSFLVLHDFLEKLARTQLSVLEIFNDRYSISSPSSNGRATSMPTVHSLLSALVNSTIGAFAICGGRHTSFSAAAWIATGWCCIIRMWTLLDRIQHLVPSFDGGDNFLWALAPARMTHQPLTDLGMLVGGVVVGDVRCVPDGRAAATFHIKRALSSLEQPGLKFFVAPG